MGTQGGAVKDFEGVTRRTVKNMIDLPWGDVFLYGVLFGFGVMFGEELYDSAKALYKMLKEEWF